MKNIDGLFLIHKPQGITSHDVVHRVRRILQTKSVGHCGTLDPMAEGLMVLIVGEATKLSQYILEGNKSYELEMLLGVQTDTLDVTGKILNEKNVDVSESKVLSTVEQFIGEKNWPVPIYSAIKVNGKKLYEVAREQGKTSDEMPRAQLETPLKKMKFWDVQFLKKEDRRVRFHLHCSKGSYVRTWVDEFGKILGCGAALSSLVRTSSEPFQLKQSVTLEKLESQVKNDEVWSSFIPLAEALPGVKKIKVFGQDLRLLKNGQIGHELRIQLIQKFDPSCDEMVMIIDGVSSQLLALIGLDPVKGFVLKRGFVTNS